MSELVHINKIEMVDCEDLYPMVVFQNDTCKLHDDPDFQEIPIYELVGVNIEDSYENNQKVFTTTATFNTDCKQPMTDRKKAFRLTSVSGLRYLIGINLRPFPVIKEKNAFPEKPTDSSMKTVTITWKALYPMLLIMD